MSSTVVSLGCVHIMGISEEAGHEGNIHIGEGIYEGALHKALLQKDERKAKER